MNNTSAAVCNCSSAASPEGLLPESTIFVIQTIFFGSIVLLTVFGNMLIILAIVPSSHLRSPTHALIANLAVADLLLGVTVLPFSAAREIYGGRWLFGPTLCLVWTTMDVFCCTASILSLCGISLDRYIGVSRPLAYSRILNRRRVRGLIVSIWSLSLSISMAPSLGWRQELNPGECHVNKQLGYVVFSACGSFYLPALAILVLYSLVYRAAIRHSRFLLDGTRVTRSEVTLRVHKGRISIDNSCHVDHNVQESSMSLAPPPSEFSKSAGSGGGAGETNNTNAHSPAAANKHLHLHLPRGSDACKHFMAGFERRAAKFHYQKKAAKTLSVVVGGFFFCWCPFFIILPLDAACPSCQISGTLFSFTFWLGYINSCLNPFIYACSSRELRRAFLDIIRCRCRLCPCNRDQKTSISAPLTYSS